MNETFFLSQISQDLSHLVELKRNFNLKPKDSLTNYGILIGNNHSICSYF